MIASGAAVYYRSSYRVIEAMLNVFKAFTSQYE